MFTSFIIALVSFLILPISPCNGMGKGQETGHSNEYQQIIVKTLQPDKSFSEQVRNPNTIYKISYIFDLKGSKINLPENCVLKFEGGRIFNGTLIGNRTRIESPVLTIFDSVTIKGTWDVEEAYTEWFGAQGDGKHDDGPAIRAALASPFRIIRLLGTNVYGIGSYANKNEKIGLETFHDNTKIIGSNKGTEESRCPQIRALPNVQFKVLLKVSHRSTVFSGFQIYGNYKKGNKGFTDLNVETGLEVGNGKKMLGYFQMDGVEVGYVKGDAVYLSTFCCEIRNTLVRYCDRGFVFDGKKSTVTSCLLSNCFVIASRHEAYYAYKTFYSNFVQCYADRCGFDFFGGSFDVNDISPVFHISNSRGVNFSGCGSELAAKILYFEESCNIVVTGGTFNVTDEAWIESLDSYLDFYKCNSVTILGSHIFETRNNLARIKARESENISLIRCLYRDHGVLNNVTRSCVTPGSSFIYLYESQDERCASDSRPSGLTEKEIGYRVFDTDLNKPLWWSKIGWVDANGNKVE